MAASWYWALLLCQLAAWGSAAPVDAEKNRERTPGANSPDLSSSHTQLTGSTRGASGTAVGSAESKSAQNIQNDQPQAPQQASGKSKGTENSSVKSQSGAAESTKTGKDTEKSREGQTGTSDPVSVPKPQDKDSKQDEAPSIKTPKTKSDGPGQESGKTNSVHTKNIQKNADDLEELERDASHPDLNVKEVPPSKVLEPKDQTPQSHLPTQKAVSKEEDSSEVSPPQENTSFPKPKTKDPKQEEAPLIKAPKSDDPSQDSQKTDSVQTKNTQEDANHLQESKTGASDPGLNVKEVPPSKVLERKDQTPPIRLPAQKTTSAKEDSSEVSLAQGDTSFSKSKTKDPKQGDVPSVDVVNLPPDAQDPPSNLDPVPGENEKMNPDLSDPDFSEQEEADDEESKQMEDVLAKDQDPQSDLSLKHLHKSNPAESKKEVADPEDEPKKGLGDEKKKSAKHEEDSEGTLKNGSENSHFFAYLVTTAIVVAALYIAYHNKRKIIAFALEGKKSKTARRPKSSDYQRLDQKI